MAHQFYRARQSGPGYDNARKKTTDKLSGAVLDEIKKQKQEKGIKTKDFGEFDEAPGGGTPVNGGGRGAMKKDFVVADSPKDPIAIAAKEKGEKVRYMQPRNDDGTFTYNSTNGKGLSTKKSRGHTDIPWLAGVDLTFLKKGAVFSYEKDGQKVERLLSGITLSAEQLHDALSIYLEDERGFAGIVGGAITKKGRTSNVEKEKISTGEKGKINQLNDKQLENMSENRKAELEKAASSVRKGPFRVGKNVNISPTGAYNPTRTSKGADRPSATGTTNYSKDVSNEDILNFTEQLKSQGLTEATPEMVRDMIDSGIISLETGGREKTGSGSSEEDIKKAMGL